MSKKVYVLYWVDLDCHCLKKSIVKIKGVFSTLERAEFEKDIRCTYKGYSDDERCYYHEISEHIIDSTKDNDSYDEEDIHYEDWYDDDDDKCSLTEKDFPIT